MKPAEWIYFIDSETVNRDLEDFEVTPLDQIEHNHALLQTRFNISASLWDHFEKSGRPEFSVCVQREEEYGLCLIDRRTSARVERLKKFRVDCSELLPPSICLLEGSAQARTVALRASLLVLTRWGHKRLDADERFTSSLMSHGLVRVASTSEVETLREVETNLGRGKSLAELFPDGAPDGARFLKLQQSPNRLLRFTFPAPNPPSETDSQIQVLSRKDILECAPLIFRVFGELSFMNSFLAKAVPEYCLGIRIAGEIVAAVLVRRDKVPYIATIFVKPEIRKRRIAARLLREVLRRMQEAQESLVLAHVRERNAASNRLFRSFGFQHVNSLEALLDIGKLQGMVKHSDANALGIPRTTIERTCRENGLRLI